MSALCFMCPATGQQVATGIDIDPASFASLSQAITELRCPHCREPHVLAGVSAWLVNGRTPNEWPFGEAGASGTADAQPHVANQIESAATD